MDKLKKSLPPEEPFEDPEEKPIEEEDDLFYSPTSPIISALNDVLTAGKDLPGLQSRKKAAHSSTAISIKENSSQRVVESKSRSSELYVYISDIDKLVGNNKPAKNFLAFSLIKANEQILHNGELTGDSISFPLQELVDVGMYTTTRRGRSGFIGAMEVLTSLKVKGHITKGKKEITEEKLRVLFTGYDISNSRCTVYLNPHINWSFTASYFTIFPGYFFSLKLKAQDLVSYIFTLARQKNNLKKLADKGYFTIKLRTIWSHLGLPSEKDNSNPGRTIREPIEDAIEQIEDAQLEYYNNEDLQMELINPDTEDIVDFLDKGYLKVYLSGHFSEMFISLYQREQKKVEAAQKRRENIANLAIAKNLAEKMKEEKEAKEFEDPPVEKT